MFSQQAIAGYKRAIHVRGEPVTVQRITGVAPNVTTVTANIRAIVMDYKPQTPALKVDPEGAVTLGARTIIVLDDDLWQQGYPLPVTKNDKVVVRGEQLNIMSVDPNTRNIAGATEIVAEGV